MSSAYLDTQFVEQLLAAERKYSGAHRVRTIFQVSRIPKQSSETHKHASSTETTALV